VGHVTAPELHYQEGSAPSRGTRDSTGAPLSGRQSPKSWDTWQHRISRAELPSVEVRCCHMSHGSELCLPEREAPMLSHVSKEVKSRATGHVTAPKLTSARRRGSKLRDTWRRQNSPQQGGEVQSHGTCGGSGVYLYREVWSEVTAYVTTRGCTYCSLSWVPSIQGTDTPNFL
jgi:hypothetical protein